MALSEDLISKLVKVTNDRGTENKKYTVYGSIVTDGSRNYVKMDGSDISTPIETTVEVNPGDRVIVDITNHIATVTGNTTDPSIGVKRAEGIESSITQTASEIRMEVNDTVSGLSSRITQNADNITSVVSNQNEFSEFKQTVEGFSFMGKGGSVKLQGGDINLTGAIKFSDLSDSATVQSDINSAKSTANSAYNAATDAKDSADEALVTVSGFTITEGTKTYIDGKMIYSESIYAGSLHLGGELKVYKKWNGTTVGGYLGYCTGFNSTSGIGIMHNANAGQCICTDQAARLSYGGDSQVVANTNGVWIDGHGSIICEIGGVPYTELTDTYFTPYAARPIKLGTSSAPWSAVYSSTSTIQSSDRNKKNSIEDLPEKYLTMFDSLRPRRFKMNDGTSDRYHTGYIAQEVEEAMNDAGIDSQEFGGFIKDKDQDGNDIYMLRYGEFYAIYSAKIKQLESRNAELEARIAKLEALLTK